MNLLFVAIYLFFTTLGLTLMKLGGNSLSLVLNNEINFKISFLTLFGFISYFISFALWQKILVLFDLSVIVPITNGIIQILVLIIGVLIFKEKISFQGLLGIGLIIIGIALLTISKTK